MAINQATLKKPWPYQKFNKNVLPAACQLRPLKPVEIVNKKFYSLSGSDGPRVEVEEPVHSTAEQLNALSQSKWRPPQEILAQQKLEISQGQLFEDVQIRCCLLQIIRLGGLEITVETTDHNSVAACNAQIEDYNLRCGHFQCKTGALGRVRSQVEPRKAYLDVDVRRHRGPRQPERVPTFKLASSRMGYRSK